MQIGLINPNTNMHTTQMMVAIAQSGTSSFSVTGVTAKSGPKMIQDAKALDASAQEVVTLGLSLGHLDGIIVSAFGDPGVAHLAAALSQPVIGIGGASARLAARQGGPFAVVTTTGGLVERIDRLMLSQCNDGAYLGTYVTTGDTDTLMSDPTALDAALLQQVVRATEAGALHAIIGGGPLGMAAVRLASNSPIPLINPIHAAVSEMSVLLGSQRREKHDGATNGG